MNFLKFAALNLVALFSTGATLTAGGVDIGDILVGVVTCTGGQANCSLTQTTGINSSYNIFAKDPATSDVEDLGTIEKETIKNFSLPEKVWGYSMYSFTPSEGDFKGKTIYLALREVEPIRRGLDRAGQTPIEFLSLNQGANPAKNWLREGRFFVDKTNKTAPKTSQMMSRNIKTTQGVDVTIMPNGNTSIIGPDGAVVEFETGMKVKTKK